MYNNLALLLSSKLYIGPIFLEGGAPLGNNIRKLGHKKGLTQEALAFKAQVSRQTINAVEVGRYRPSVVLALKLSVILGATVGEIFHLEENDWDEM